jgi:hypothetical protein
MRSGNFMLSWIKNTGMLFPTINPVTFFGIELDSETADISDCVGGSSRAEDSAEAEEDRGLSGCVGEYSGRRVFLQALVHLEGSERSSATGVDHSLRDSFMVEAVNLLADSVVFEELRADLVLRSDLKPIIQCGSQRMVSSNSHGESCDGPVLVCFTP